MEVIKGTLTKFQLLLKATVERCNGLASTNMLNYNYLKKMADNGSEKSNEAPVETSVANASNSWNGIDIDLAKHELTSSESELSYDFCKDPEENSESAVHFSNDLSKPRVSHGVPEPAAKEASVSSDDEFNDVQQKVLTRKGFADFRKVLAELSFAIGGESQPDAIFDRAADEIGQSNGDNSNVGSDTLPDVVEVEPSDQINSVLQLTKPSDSSQTAGTQPSDALKSESDSTDSLEAGRLLDTIEKKMTVILTSEEILKVSGTYLNLRKEPADGHEVRQKSVVTKIKVTKARDDHAKKVKPFSAVNGKDLEMKINPLFMKQFRAHARQNNRMKSGVVMCKRQSYRWLKKAGFFEGIINADRANECFTSEVGASLVLNVHNYVRYLRKVCLGAIIEFEEVLMRLSKCPPLKRKPANSKGKRDIGIQTEEVASEQNQKPLKHTGLLPYVLLE